MKVTFEEIANEHGGPHNNVCPWPFCRLAGWACPDEEDDDPGEPTEGARAAPPSLTFKVADVA
jgi:hypothetical protein